MLVKLEILCSKTSHVDDSEEICLALLNIDVLVLSTINESRIWDWLRAAMQDLIQGRLVIIYQVRGLSMIPILNG
jgi:hypothetical protein